MQLGNISIHMVKLGLIAYTAVKKMHGQKMLMCLNKCSWKSYCVLIAELNLRLDGWDD